MGRYAMGLDFGTLSGRAVLIDTATGGELACSVLKYRHGTLSERFLDGSALPSGYALQCPGDYLEVLRSITSDCIKQAGISPSQISGVGVDFTASTLLPVTADGTPLCSIERFSRSPHAYVKLWKHHAAQREADDITALAKKRGQHGSAITAERFPANGSFRKYFRYYVRMRKFIKALSFSPKRRTG